MRTFALCALVALLTAAPLLTASAAHAPAAVRVFSNGYTDSHTSAPFTVVAPGATVTFHFAQGVHSVTAGVAPQLNGAARRTFDSGIQEPGATFDVTFAQKGDHVYYCTLHPTMRGVVRVA